MANRIFIDEKMYESMLDYIHQMHFTNKLGVAEDVEFILDDFWLQNTEVIENVEKRSGAWTIFLVFAHHTQPLKFIKRKITIFASLKKAELAAQYMRRLAAKDQRGTLVIDRQFIKVNLS